MEMQTIEKNEELIEKEESMSESMPEPIIEPITEPIEKPKRRSSNNLEGHSKTCYNFCSKCGGKKSTYESTYNNRLKRYGSVDAMNKNYLCKKCRKA